MPYDAKHGGMADVVVLDAAGIGLPDVAEVADAQGDATQAKVQRQELAQAERITWMGTEDVVAYALLGYLVITLSKFRAEHYAYHREVGLIIGLHRQLAKTEGIGSPGRQGKVDAETPLRRIVAIPAIVQESKICANQHTSFQVKIGQGRVVIMPSSIVCKASAKIVGCRRRIVRRSKHGMESALKGDVLTSEVRHPLALCQERNLQAGVFHRRKIAVKLTGAPDAQEESSGCRVPVRYWFKAFLLGKAYNWKKEWK